MSLDELINLEAPCESDANVVEPLASELQAEGEAGVLGSNWIRIHLLGTWSWRGVSGRYGPHKRWCSEWKRVAVQTETVIGFEVKLDKGHAAENAPVYEWNDISVQERCILLNGILCIYANIHLQLQVCMFSEESFISLDAKPLPEFGNYPWLNFHVLFGVCR